MNLNKELESGPIIFLEMIFKICYFDIFIKDFLIHFIHQYYLLMYHSDKFL